MPHLMQDILRKLAVRSPQLKTILKHEDSPGKFYFRKTLGQTFVLEDTKEEEMEVDENKMSMYDTPSAKKKRKKEKKKQIVVMNLVQSHFLWSWERSHLLKK